MKNNIFFIGEIPFVEKRKTLPNFSGKGRNLYECYDRPSNTKREIFNDWWAWSKRNNVKDFGIYTYNGFMFTLTGRIEIEGQEYAIYITKTRQELYKIV